MLSYHSQGMRNSSILPYLLGAHLVIQWMVKWQLPTCTREVICSCSKENRWSKVKAVILRNTGWTHLAQLLKNTDYFQVSSSPPYSFYSLKLAILMIYLWQKCRKKWNGILKGKKLQRNHEICGFTCVRVPWYSLVAVRFLTAKISEKHPECWFILL